MQSHWNEILQFSHDAKHVVYDYCQDISPAKQLKIGNFFTTLRSWPQDEKMWFEPYIYAYGLYLRVYVHNLSRQPQNKRKHRVFRGGESAQKSCSIFLVNTFGKMDKTPWMQQWSGRTTQLMRYNTGETMINFPNTVFGHENPVEFAKFVETNPAFTWIRWRERLLRYGRLEHMRQQLMRYKEYYWSPDGPGFVRAQEHYESVQGPQPSKRTRLEDGGK